MLLSGGAQTAMSGFTFDPPQVPDDFSTVTLEQAKQLVPSFEDAEHNRCFIAGDHFQQGKGWVGPGPGEGEQGHSDFLHVLARVFVSKNVLNECCDRLSSAVLGREPRWAWVPRRKVTDEAPVTVAEQEAIDELEQALTEWWDTREVHKCLKQQLKYMLWALESTWRLFVPSGLTDQNGSLGTITTLDDALKKIFLEIPDPEFSTVYEHPNTRQRLGIVLYKDVASKQERAELSYVDAQGKTVIKIVPSASVAQAANNFGEHLPMFRVHTDEPLITRQTRELQRQLNMTLTLLGKGLVDNHFVEKLFKDILPPGHWEYEDDKITRKAFIPDKSGRTTGGRTDSYLQSIDYRNEQNTTVLANGEIVFRDPLDPTGTIKGIEYWYQALLEEMRQDHVLINQSATPSGKSRDEARADFADSGEEPEMQCKLSGRELLLTVVSMAEEFMGKPGKYTSLLRPVFQPRPKYGQLSTEERKQAIEEAEKGFRADETAMADIGIDDVDAEVAIINKSARGQLRLSSERADVVEKWAADFPREVALKLTGFEDKKIKEIMKSTTEAEAADPGLVDPTQLNPTPTAKPGVVVAPTTAKPVPVRA